MGWPAQSCPCLAREFGDSPRGRGPRWQRDEVMWKPPVAQVCRPLVQPALLGLEQRCGASGHGDRSLWGWEELGLLRVRRKLWESSWPQTAAPGLGSGSQHSEEWGCSPSGTHPHRAITTRAQPAPPLSDLSPPLPPSLPQFPLQRAEMEPSCCDPHPEPDSPTRHILTGPGSAPQSPPVPCSALSPRIHRVWHGAGPGPPGATLLLPQFLSDQLPGTKG